MKVKLGHTSAPAAPFVIANKLRSLLSLGIGVLAFCGTAGAVPLFQPLIDEFWVMKGASGGPSVEIFRDSFDDAVTPPSGPQDGLGGNPDTYTVFGGGGMTSEAAGKLTMTPKLGDPVLITAAYADLFTGALKLRTTTNGTPNSLEAADSFEIHGLFDLTSLPAITGQAFGVRASDRAVNLGNNGNDTMALLVGRSRITGRLGVALHENDFEANTVDFVDFFHIDTVTDAGGATQIELVITKAANTAMIGAYFKIYGAGGLLGNSVLLAHDMNPFSALQNANLTIYNGEEYTRAQFYSVDRVPVPEPATLALLGLGLAGLALRRSKRC